MYVMQYSIGEIYNSVRDCERHMHMATKKHTDAILQVAKYCYDCPNRGLKLKPDAECDVSQDFEFTMGGRSDSDYAKDPQTRKTISGRMVLLNRVLIWTVTVKLS